jgi:serpin B
VERLFMKKLRNIRVIHILFLIIILFIPGLSPCSEQAPNNDTAAKAVNAFAVDSYGQISAGEGNLIFSPYSISMCLAMAYEGARGETQTQMAKTLHVRPGRLRVGKAFSALNAQVQSSGRAKGVELNIANALWAEKSYKFRKEYLESVRSNCVQSGGWSSRIPLVGRLVEFVSFSPQDRLRQVDFKGGPESARNTINRWVEGKTRNRIKDLFPSGSINQDTRLVLSNAIYFKGVWEHQFKKKSTSEEPFYLLNGKDVKVPMMSQTEWFRYMEEANFQALEMAYKGGELAMVLLLPSKQRHFDEFEKSITFERLGDWIGKLGKTEVEVYLPRFNMTSEFSVRKALKTLGVIDAFTPRIADFSGMTESRDLFISEVFHKAFVETNEEGTEAAAATGGVFEWMGEEGGAKIPTFRADHPFVFIILHRPSKCILFMGRVTRP